MILRASEASQASSEVQSRCRSLREEPLTSFDVPGGAKERTH